MSELGCLAPLLLKSNLLRVRTATFLIYFPAVLPE
jgi:hypothetical protein